MDTVNVPLPASLTGAITAPLSSPAAASPMVRQPWQSSATVPTNDYAASPQDAFMPASSPSTTYRTGLSAPLLPGLDMTHGRDSSPTGMEPVSGFMDHTTHELYLPASVMGELTQNGAQPNPFQRVDYARTPDASASEHLQDKADLASNASKEPMTSTAGKKSSNDKAGSASDAKNKPESSDKPSDTSTESKSEVASANSDKTPAELSEEQKAVAEFMQAYHALKESVSDPEVSAAIARMRDRMLHPWSINPFQFLKDLNTIRKDDSVKKFLKESKDLGPYWDKLQAALPQSSQATKTDVAAEPSPSADLQGDALTEGHNLTDDEALPVDGASRSHKPHATHRHSHAAAGREKPTIIPVSDLPPELLEALMQEGQ